MAVSEIAVSLDEELLAELDHLVAGRAFNSRSQAVQAAVEEKVKKIRRQRLADECARADPAEEKAMAEEGMAGELAQWPEY